MAVLRVPRAHGAHADWPARVARAAGGAFWIAVGAAVALYAFFVALGAFRPDDVTGVTIGVALLAALWVLHAVVGQRRAHGRLDPRSARQRERRGF